MTRDLAFEVLRDDGERHWLLSQELEWVERRNRILTLVRRGGTAEAVAELMTREGHPVTAATVRKMVKRHLEQLHTIDAMTVEELRTQENARLDEAMRTLYPLIVQEGGPNLRAMDRFIRLSERRAKLNGLDSPTRIDFGVGDALRSLGVDRDAIQRATEAFTTAFQDDDIPDAEVVEDGEAEDEAQGPLAAGAEQEEGGQGRPQEQAALEAPKTRDVQAENLAPTDDPKEAAAREREALQELEGQALEAAGGA